MTRRLVNVMDMPDTMTDISESGIEAAAKVIFVEGWGTPEFRRNLVVAVLQAYLPFHPPASREEGLRLADQIVCEEWNAWAMANADRPTSALVAAILERLRTIPTKPEAKEPAIDLALIEATARKINPGRSEDHIKSVALDALTIFRALQSKKPE